MRKGRTLSRCVLVVSCGSSRSWQTWLEEGEMSGVDGLHAREDKGKRRSIGENRGRRRSIGLAC